MIFIVVCLALEELCSDSVHVREQVSSSSVSVEVMKYALAQIFDFYNSAFQKRKRSTIVKCREEDYGYLGRSFGLLAALNLFGYHLYSSRTIYFFR